jgi:aminopeptidase N
LYVVTTFIGQSVKPIALLLLVGPLGAIAAADTYPRQPGVDALHYAFRITLGDDSDTIDGEASIRVRFAAADVTSVSFDLASPASGKGMTVTEVTSTASIARYVHEADRVRIPLPEPPAAGAEQTFTVRYRGAPADGFRFLKTIHGARAMFSENWPNQARQWLPMIDHPYDKATGEFIVTAPSHYQVVSNGVLLEETDLGGGVRRTHWKQSVPIASWLYALGIARFAVHHPGDVQGVPLQTWVFPEDRDRGIELFESTTTRAMDFFARRIGPYPYEKLANVEAAGMSGGTEHATAIFYGEKGVTIGRGPVVHEVAHQWWGNAVTERDWDDVWLSEGFATYFTLLFTEHDEGRDAFVAGLQRSRDSVREFEKRLPDTPVIHRNLADMGKVLNQFVYQKGGWTLHMLRGLMGDEPFWSAIREYYRRYRDQNASTDELRQVFEQFSPRHRDLRWFFDQWLRRSGLPRLEGTWRYDVKGKRVEIDIAQMQAGDPYRLDLDFGIVDKPGTLPRVQRVRMDERRATFTIEAPAAPESVTLDPNTWLLMEQGTLRRLP